MHTPLPQWKTHIYWHEKSQFLLTEDTYEDWVMFIVEQGSFHFRIGEQGDDDKPDELGQFGDIVICPPYTRFQRETISPLTFHFIVFSFPEPNLTQDPLSPSSGQPSGKISLLSFADRFSFNNSQLRQQDSLISSTVTAYREHIMLDMWFMALQQWQNQSDITIAQPISSVMQHAASLLKQYAMSGLNLKEIAKQIGLTPVQFTRQFQAAFHVTPIHFITSIRMRKACKLLTETDSTLDEIAQQCGYENGFYLSRLFQKHMNLRPSQYRKTHRL